MIVEEILARFQDVGGSGPRWSARCPAHDDKTPSLTITEAPDGKVLVHCHAGCMTEDVVDSVGLTMSDLFPTLSVKRSVKNGLGDRSNGKRKHKKKKCSGEVVATYDYTDETGELLFQKVRWRQRTEEDQKYSVQRPDGAGWVWGLDADTRRVLYRLPQVQKAAQAGGLIWLVEGEKDADRLVSLGFIATTNFDGAEATWQDDYSGVFTGAKVVVLLPDNDPLGREHMQAAARSLHRVVPCVRVVELPGLPEKGDVSDWLSLGGDATELLRLVRKAPDWSPEPPKRKLPPPVSMRELRRIVADEPQAQWLVPGILPTDANILLAAYPKCGKTMVIEDLAIALASGTPFLGRFAVVGQRKVGLVLMEDRKRTTLTRLERLCLGRGIALDDLEGWLHVWSRPPLMLGDETAGELGDYAAERELDFLAVDSWQYVGGGNSDRADEVMPQLSALSAARAKRPGLTVELTHHARKEARGDDPKALRLTDLIRNSSAFGAWYDVGLVLSRRNETAPVKVRTESRDAPPLPPYAVLIEDECSGDPTSGVMPSGWLRLRVSEASPEEADTQAQAERLVPQIRAVLESEGGTIGSKAQLVKRVAGSPNDVYAALELMTKQGEITTRVGARNAVAITLVREG